MSGAGTAPGGVGWEIDEQTLRPRITDHAAFAAAHEADPLLGVLSELWSGRPDRALALLGGHPDTVRVRALRADCHRDLGDTALAVRLYDALSEEVAGSPHEAVVAQHHAKALAADGRLDRARERATIALRLRRGTRADAGLIRSSEQTLERIERWSAASRDQGPEEGRSAADGS